jgi:branched-chain amino acid aminotransferase
MPSVVEPLHGPLPHEALAHGCFETMRAYQGKLFRLEGHLDRLYGSAQFLGTAMPASREALRRPLWQALQRSGISEAMVRVAMMPQPMAEALPSIVVRPVPLPTLAQFRQGLRVAVVPARKFAVGSISPQAKYSARLGSVLALMDAQLRGVDEALFMDTMGSVTESTASNFGIVVRGAILTPPCYLGLLSGITRDVLFELARALRVPIEEALLTRHDLYNAQEAFLTSTLKEVIGVTRIDGRVIAGGRPGPVTQRLLKGFRALVRRELRLR